MLARGASARAGRARRAASRARSGSRPGRPPAARTTSRPRVARAHAAHRLAEHLLLVGEVEIHRVVLAFRVASARRGGSRGCRRRSVGTRDARRARRCSSVVADAAASTSTSTQPQPASSVSTSVDGAGEHHRVAGEHRALHAELHPAEPARRPGPVGEVALEPRRLVRRVQEDVLGAVAVDREVVVVVHRPPVAARERAEHDGGRGHVVRRARAARRPSCTVVERAASSVRHDASRR